MANIAHSVLTGSDLHEPKGIGTAAINTVYISNGAGSGSWSVVPNPFGTGLFHVREQQTRGTLGGSTNTASVWNTRILNTIVTNDLGTPSLSSNQVTIPAGTWYATARITGVGSTFNGQFISRIKLFNITTSSDIIFGTGHLTGQFVAGSSSTGEFTLAPDLYGRFTLSGTTVIELRWWQSGGVNAGNPVSTGTTDPEIYADLLLWKVG